MLQSCSWMSWDHVPLRMCSLTAQFTHHRGVSRPRTAQRDPGLFLWQQWRERLLKIAGECWTYLLSNLDCNIRGSQGLAAVSQHWRHPRTTSLGGHAAFINSPVCSLAAAAAPSQRCWDHCQSFGSWIGVCWLWERLSDSSPQKNTGSVWTHL